MNTDIIKPEWVALDWGTSRLRAFAMGGGSVLDKATSEDGMNTLTPSEFAPVFERTTKRWRLDPTTPVMACGMIGARQGWAEAPYRATPCVPLGTEFTTPPDHPNIHIIPGLSQSVPADVMRGEETQIAGFLALNPGWDGVICLPGTHTKWAELSAGEVVSFQTFMTGEMFDLLAHHSVLRHTVAPDGWDAEAFDTALSDTMARPERLAAWLFGLRAEHLLNGADVAKARARLSGLLLGAELAAARPYWLGRQIAVLGSGSQAEAYSAGLQAQGVPVTLAEADRMTLAGLTAAYRSLQKAPT